MQISRDSGYSSKKYMLKLLYLISLSCALIFIFQSQSHAASTGSCWLSVDTLNFGSVSSKGGVSSTNVTVKCNQYGQSKPVRVTFCLFVPEGSPTLASNRRRISSNTGDGDLSAYLSYDLYYDSAMTQRIDTKANASSLVCQNKVFGVGQNDATYTVPIYGKIYPGQNVKASYYTSFNMPMTLIMAYSEEAYPSKETVIATGKSETNNLLVTANYENSCNLYSTPDLNFGQTSDLSNAVSGVTTISLSCPTNTSWKVGLDNGLNYDGTSRRMKNAGNYIKYSLYKSADLSQTWDNTTYSQGTGTSGTQQINIYGRVPAQGSFFPAGDYVDTVTVTLTY